MSSSISTVEQLKHHKTATDALNHYVDWLGIMLSTAHGNEWKEYWARRVGEARETLEAFQSRTIELINSHE